MKNRKSKTKLISIADLEERIKRDSKIIELSRTGMSTRTVGKIMGLSCHAIFLILKANGVTSKGVAFRKS